MHQPLSLKKQSIHNMAKAPEDSSVDTPHSLPHRKGPPLQLYCANSLTLPHPFSTWADTAKQFVQLFVHFRLYTNGVTLRATCHNHRVALPYDSGGH